VTREVVYGRNAVREALRGRRRVHEVLVAEQAAGLEWLTGVEITLASPARLDQVAGSPDHQGVVALADPYPYVDPDAVAAGPRPLIVALDQITDPRNLGAVARAAECAGATGLVMPRHGAAAVTPAVCKASAGAVEHLPIAIVRNLADWLTAARSPSLWSYAATVGGRPYDQVELGDGAILVIGSEGRGVRPRVRASCDGEIGIPLMGRVESLNAATAAGILLFEAARQRKFEPSSRA
jgi:23S rRNA (guanosine2251-2'-O)-methyltransferase